MTYLLMPDNTWALRPAKTTKCLGKITSLKLPVCPLKIYHPKRKYSSSSNHPFSGAMLNLEEHNKCETKRTENGSLGDYFSFGRAYFRGVIITCSSSQHRGSWKLLPPRLLSFKNNRVIFHFCDYERKGSHCKTQITENEYLWKGNTWIHPFGISALWENTLQNMESTSCRSWDKSWKRISKCREIGFLSSLIKSS